MKKQPQFRCARRPRVLIIERLSSRQLLSADVGPIVPIADLPAEVRSQHTQQFAAPSDLNLIETVTSSVGVQFWQGDRLGAGVLVRIYNTRGNLVATGITKDNGRASIEHPENGVFRAYVFLRRGSRAYSGHFDFAGRVSANVSLQEVVTRPSGIPVGGRNSITATVRDPNGSPLKGETVRLLDGNGEELEAYVTNEKGRVSFWNLAEAVYAVEVYDHASGTWVRPSQSTIDFASRGSRRWTPNLQIEDNQTELRISNAHIGKDDNGFYRVYYVYRFFGKPVPFQVALYQSDNLRFDAADRLVYQAALTVDPGTQTAGVQSFRIPWTTHRDLVPDPQRPQLILVADPQNRISEVNKNNNVADVPWVECIH